MPHHLVSEISQKTFCIYCKREVPSNEWKSDWHLEMHYKTLKCTSCGRDLHIRVNFEGSGHDSWAGLKKCGTIEEKIKTLEKIKILEEHFPKK